MQHQLPWTIQCHHILLTIKQLFNHFLNHHYHLVTALLVAPVFLRVARIWPTVLQGHWCLLSFFEDRHRLQARILSGQFIGATQTWWFTSRTLAGMLIGCFGPPFADSLNLVFRKYLRSLGLRGTSRRGNKWNQKWRVQWYMGLSTNGVAPTVTI